MRVTIEKCDISSELEFEALGRSHAEVIIASLVCLRRQKDPVP